MYRYITLLILLFAPVVTIAHPMPNSIVELSVSGDHIKGVVKVPVPELENALAAQNGNVNDTIFLYKYFAEHIAAHSGNKQWKTVINNISYAEDEMYYANTKGNYKEAVVVFTLLPEAGTDVRSFTFAYDAVIHQVVTHKIFVVLKQDWENGIYEHEAGDSTMNDERVLGVIATDIATEKVFPLEISLEKGSNRKGFKAMMALGMHHISEGADHLLFLLVLLLTAPLIVSNKKWKPSGNLVLSLQKILKITLAFTIGHSITLIFATLGWVSLPSRPVEILIAFSILITAAHAVRPLFPNKEVVIAAGFGLVHGLAFATILTAFHLKGTPLILSLLGFNIGIELMQLIVILVTVPWLIMLSEYALYKAFRIAGALFAAIAALGWMMERVTGRQNFISGPIDKIVPYGKYLVLFIALLAIVSWAIHAGSRSVTGKKTST